MVVAESATDNGWPTSFPFTLSVDFATVGVELVDVTSKGALAGGLRTWNISRAQDLTVATTHVVGARIRHVIAARDLREARQARSLQPADANSSYVIAETSFNTEFTDSTPGDLIYKVQSGQRHRFGTADLPGSLLTIGADGVIAKNLPLTASAGFRRGNGMAFGTNFVTYHRNNAYSLASASWTNIGYETNDQLIADDGVPIYTSPTFISQVAGMYFFNAVITFTSSTAGTVRGLRWITQGGTILASTLLPAAITGTNPITVFGMAYLPGGAYAIRVQAYQDSGAAMAMATSSTAAPSSAAFGLLL